MRGAALLALFGTGCSFLAVHGPTRPTDLITDPSSVQCTDSDLVPSLDSLGGAAAIGVAGGGIILQHTRDDGSPKHFDLIYAPILLVASILYWSAASYGTNRVEHCREVKERAGQVKPIPIDVGKPDPKIEISPAE